MDSGHEFTVGGMPEMKGHSSVGGEVVIHVLARSSMLPARSGLDIRLSKLPCFDSLRTEDVSVNLFECIPLVVRSLRVEGVCCAAMIEARNGFRDRNISVGSSLLLPIGLVGAVTAVGLVRPLSKWDRRDSVPSRGREGYVVLPKSSERVSAAVAGRVEPSPSPWDGQRLSGEVGRRGVDVFALDVDVVSGEWAGGISLILCEGSFVIPCTPGAGGVVGVINGLRRRSFTSWVCCCLGTLYVPR